MTAETYSLSWSKKELIKILDYIIRQYDYNCDDDILLDDSMVVVATLSDPKNLMVQFNEYISKWFYYLSIYLSVQDYETCCKIRDVISIEESQFHKLILQYRPDIVKNNPTYLKDATRIVKNKYINITNAYGQR